MEEELIARASHTHALFTDDNSVVYYHLEKATRGTSYAASIKPFTRAKDGRGAWKALTSQYAGKDKWEAEIKRQEQLLHTRIWKGQSNFSLENFISQHRNAYVSMQASAEHVQYQLQMNIQGLDSCSRRFNALMQDFKLPWQASKLIMALKV